MSEILHNSEHFFLAFLPSTLFSLGYIGSLTLAIDTIFTRETGKFYKSLNCGFADCLDIKT